MLTYRHNGEKGYIMAKNYELEVQAKLIKNWGKISRLNWGKVDDTIFFTTDGFVGYYIPEKHFLIDLKQFHIRSEESTLAHTYANPNGDYVPAKYVGTVLDKRDKMFAVYEGADRKAYFDIKLIKEFQTGDFTYQIGTATQPMRVYLYGKLFAIVCPVRYTNL